MQIDRVGEIDRTFFEKADAIAQRKMQSRADFARRHPTARVSLSMTDDQLFAKFRSLALEELQEGSEDYGAAQLACDERSEAEYEAAAELASTIPTTVAGAKALTDYTSSENFRRQLALEVDGETPNAMALAVLRSLGTFLARG
jgi:hypothetical protein